MPTLLNRIRFWWKRRQMLRRFMKGEWIRMRTNDGRIWWVQRYTFQTSTYLKYKCYKCDTILSDGPCGGAATNAVCKQCRVNYGCLPGFDSPLDWGLDFDPIITQ